MMRLNGCLARRVGISARFSAIVRLVIVISLRDSSRGSAASSHLGMQPTRSGSVADVLSDGREIAQTESVAETRSHRSERQSPRARCERCNPPRWLEPPTRHHDSDRILESAVMI